VGYINPLLRLPAARALLALGERERTAIRLLMNDLRRQANDEAETSWRRRKGPMACYWRSVATYARHVAHALRQPVAGAVSGVHPDIDHLQRELTLARRQVDDFIDAARAAIPTDEHPKDETPHDWAWQVRMLGDDRRAVYAELAMARAQLKAPERVDA
jgi:hypothetical protein